MHPKFDLRLEINAPRLEQELTKSRQHPPRMCMDIYVKKKNVGVGIELKYRTRAFRFFDTEQFDLKNHSAHDHGRYQFLRDIQRLELFASRRWINRGYAVFLTNDAAYWEKNKRKKQAYDREFQIYEGREISGRLKWDKRTSKGTKKGMEDPIDLVGHYKMHWRDYTTVRNEQPTVFRYLVIEVIKKD